MNASTAVATANPTVSESERRSAAPATRADLAGVQALVAENLALVYEIARKVVKTIPRTTTTYDDLVSYGTVGLLEAARRYEPSLTCAFSIYARHRIRGAMIDGVHSSSWYSRRQSRRFLEARRAADERQTSSHPPERPRTSKPAYVQVLLVADERLFEFGADSHSGSTSGPDDDRPFDPELVGQIPALLNALPHRERRLVELVYFEGHSLAGAGAKMGVGRSRACRIHMMALALLREASAAGGAAEDVRPAGRPAGDLIVRAPARRGRRAS